MRKMTSTPKKNVEPYHCFCGTAPIYIPLSFGIPSKDCGLSLKYRLYRIVQNMNNHVEVRVECHQPKIRCQKCIMVCRATEPWVFKSPSSKTIISHNIMA